MLEGMLIATKPRWVDHPNVVHLAENKLYQLATVRGAALPIPNSQITSSLDGARNFASGKQGYCQDHLNRRRTRSLR
jgi:glutathione synthase/RimK-type ligase-like ATP-grasp enzyme